LGLAGVSILPAEIFVIIDFGRKIVRMTDQNSKKPDLPETFEQALACAKARAAETGEALTTVANPTKRLSFDLENSTVTKAVWDDDNNLVEMTYCVVTGSVLKKKVTKPSR
jgi:hypothetical protein